MGPRVRGEDGDTDGIAMMGLSLSLRGEGPAPQIVTNCLLIIMPVYQCVMASSPEFRGIMMSRG